ncbi:DUF2599 domain-containing protein [Mycobacterium sp. SMC-2]|uniref:DUF2599 domain-containing protein n=1 Tax=Mycobacterium sp. SMC-2 TaxID=2857058 RepID=UPI0021B48056|nr:DUF2599 domain-containing protein [Mycobacterium sp. SMC-2]UXA07772.1 DUF2599 domain-containing protein [Mycobacterium sp. SMC-2]
MKTLLTAPAVVLLALWGPLGTGAADPVTVSPPFIDHTEWAQWSGLDSLRVFPTPSGRLAASGQPGNAALADEAWAEVLALAPAADTAGMRAQFICHWQLAELVEPGKASWNLEPWRPVVDDADMVASGCNPGAPEERF